MTHTEYYIAVNGRQEGPFSLNDLKNRNLSPDSLVWRPGLPEWVKAADLPEVAELLSVETAGNNHSTPPSDEPVWFAMFGANRMGPASIAELVAAGLRHDTPVWRVGMEVWEPASSRPELMERLNGQSYPNFSANPQYGSEFGAHYNNGSQQGFAGNSQYGPRQDFASNPQYGQYNHPNSPNQYDRHNNGHNPLPVRQNWLPWAIVATVLGFLGSCIGAIFGIIGIVQANKANNLYAAGFDIEGNQANSTAKIMSIIGLVLGGIGLILSGYLWKTGLNMYSFL